MSLDAVARSAADNLRAASASIDTEAALAHTLGPRATAVRRRHTTAVMLATAAAVAAVLWLLLPGVPGMSGEPVQPAQPTPAAAPGSHMTIPASLPVPDGWTVDHDGGFVLLVTDHDGVGARIYVGTPTTQYDEVSRQRSDPQGPWVAWLRGQEFLTATTTGHPSVAGQRATTVELTPAPGQEERFHALTAVASQTDDTAVETLYYSNAVTLSSWTVVPTPDGELLIVVTAEGDSRPAARIAQQTVLRSLQLTQSASN